MDFLITKELAITWNISSRRIVMLCVGGRIPGAVKMGNTWLIPKDAEKPYDGRRKRRSDTQ